MRDDEHYYYAHFIDSMVDIRKEKGFTQKELAIACGLTQSVIARIERKKSAPTIATLCKILSALDSKIEIVEISTILK